ncbi:hypothetical protein A1O3_10093 [Capronia epimyces CBS 606.96]|uniref:FAD-binding domain-containing protein n=1 Tax=Capronia epimyces CBS 606.96 TaxID=1182542 RepID=W9XJ02_9EURO|nr:uncharacterized protein A1O3_10093 [Capronia epimyces CBS 606.96]EXJ76936.1 hypothetical protein A1O3_10093 [Capronia epimyces CBS 606.96]
MPGLQVLVVGGSIGGLATALALRSQGHSVKVYEQTLVHDTLGAGVTVFPNVLSALQMLGVDLARVRATRVQQIKRSQIHADGTVQDNTVDFDTKTWPWHNATYQDLFTALWEALDVDDSRRSGPKVEFHSLTQVCRLDPANGVIYFADGSEAHGDVIIGADGVHSVCRSFVFNGKTERFRLKRHVFRAMVPRERLIDDPRTVQFLMSSGQAHSYHYQDKTLLVYPAADDQVVCIKLFYDDSTGFRNLSKDWRDPSSKTKMLRLAAGLPEECIAVLEKIRDRDLLDQPIWDMDPLDTFQKHRLALVGDAAHPMPPYCGQRIAMALEDAVALGVLLEPGLVAREVEERLKLYSRTRKVRAGAVQQTMRGLQEISICDIWTSFDPTCFHAYVLNHDEQAYARQALGVWKQQRQWLESDLSVDHLNADHQRPSTPRSMLRGKGDGTTGNRRIPQRKWWSVKMTNPRPWSKVFS